MSKTREFLKRLLPGRRWEESDGLTLVPDFHYAPAGKWHDWMYRKCGLVPGWNARESRRLYDIVFRLRMKNLNRRDKPLWSRLAFWWAVPWIYFLGVRVFGWLFFYPSGDG